MRIGKFSLVIAKVVSLNVSTVRVEHQTCLFQAQGNVHARGFKKLSREIIR